MLNYELNKILFQIIPFFNYILNYKFWLINNKMLVQKESFRQLFISNVDSSSEILYIID